MASLLQQIQEKGYQDWKALVYAIKKAELPTTPGYVSPSAIVAWIEYSLGLEKTVAQEIFNALIKMGYFSYSYYGNVYVSDR